MVDARLGGVRLAWRPAGRLQARMAHTKGWGASAAIKSDVSGAQVLNVRRVGSLAETRSKPQSKIQKPGRLESLAETSGVTKRTD